MRKNRCEQRSWFSVRKYSTARNVDLLDDRVRNGNGYCQVAMTVHDG
jgi:hypothetical protein